MAYLPIADNASVWLADVSSRKEFALTRPPVDKECQPGQPRPDEHPWGSAADVSGLQLSGSQQFIRAFGSPDTPYPRNLVYWQTGTGKTLAAISVAQEYVRQFRRRKLLGETSLPRVYIIGFTKETIMDEMLAHPELGYISRSELSELRRIRSLVVEENPPPGAMRRLASFVGALHRRITDPTRGGFYQFYGYREFANKLFIATDAGLRRGFAAQSLFESTESDFGERLATAIKNGDVAVNSDFLSDLRHGFLIADEIHNVYNINEKNNYGIALQYVFDSLGIVAPRALFLSATPITGSAGEIADLLNLLVPRNVLREPLKRSDLFASNGDLKPGALERIGTLSAGRVSFLLDSSVEDYPKRIFDGQKLDNIPYLKLVVVKMSPFQNRTLDSAMIHGSLPPDGKALNDIAFPNPQSPAQEFLEDHGAPGVYTLEEIKRLANALPDWKENTGVMIDPETGTLTGPLLQGDRLRACSEKYFRMVNDVLDAIRAGPGKILIFHPRVRTSGVLLLREIFRMNGIASDGDAPTNETICSMCGSANKDHETLTHAFMPARLVIIHGELDAATVTRNLAKFNAPTNVQGYQVRIAIGSRKIQEGVNFTAIRHQLIMSHPTDYPALLQVLGRAVRKGSHMLLPKEERLVTVKIYLAERPGGGVSPEKKWFVEKGSEFLKIQKVEQQLRQNAADLVANECRIKNALAAQGELSGMPFQPSAKTGNVRLSTYEAYGHGVREIHSIVARLRGLFALRPVWTYQDLWDELRTRRPGLPTDPHFLAEENMVLALDSLNRPFGRPPLAVERVGEYYILTRVDPTGKPGLDIGSVPTMGAQDGLSIEIGLGNLLKRGQFGSRFNHYLNMLETLYLVNDTSQPIEACLFDLSLAFHEMLLRQLILSPSATTSDDKSMIDIYHRFHILWMWKDVANKKGVRKREGIDRQTPVAYAGLDAMHLHDPGEGGWYSLPLDSFGIGKRFKENGTIVGFTAAIGYGQVDVAETTEPPIRFKIRPPIQKILSPSSESGKRDMRTFARGSVCETYPRSALDKIVRKLRVEARARGIDVPDVAEGGAEVNKRLERPLGKKPITFAARFDLAAQNRFPTAVSMCDSVKLYLLALEESERNSPGGMATGLRWTYLFNERPQKIR